MKRDLKSRLGELRHSGEIKTGRQFAEDLQRGSKDNLFPGEGREEETTFGRCYMRELRFPLNHRHGGSTLSGILTCCGPELALPARDQNIAAIIPRSSIFLDIETTGLSGGTGTWAFLIGLGWLEGEQFLLRQYFLRRPAEERAVLSHFAATTETFPAMITFNGKLFDLPLIQTRQMLTGFTHTKPALHLDLLQCARTLWKKRLPSRSLRSLEESLLGLQRYDDIPGAEIPAVYFDYLRRGKTELLKKVFHHNVLDILSMVTLLERISLLAVGRQVEHPAEALALGQLCLQQGRVAEGISYLREASSFNQVPLAEEAALELAFYYKRQGNWADAVAIWQSAVEQKSTNPFAYIELAKYYEHRCGNYQAALDLTEQTLALSAFQQNLPSGSASGLDALNHRRQRLQRRITASIPPA
jgi:uncharacterized protein